MVDELDTACDLLNTVKSEVSLSKDAYDNGDENAFDVAEYKSMMKRAKSELEAYSGPSHQQTNVNQAISQIDNFLQRVELLNTKPNERYSSVYNSLDSAASILRGIQQELREERR